MKKRIPMYLVACLFASTCQKMKSLNLDFSAIDNSFHIVAAETLDLNGNGKIDHYKITFNVAVSDSTFNASSWSISGYTGIAFDSSVTGDIANDKVIYLSFTENANACIATDLAGCDTGKAPELATTSAGAILDANLTPLPPGSNILETDKAAPVLVSAEGLDSTNQLVLRFSEAVYTNAGSGNLSLTDFTYMNNSGGNAGSLTGVVDADGSDGAVVLAADANFALADETGGDTIAAVSSEVYDLAGNIMVSANKIIDFKQNIQQIETLDVDSNGKIDHVKITFFSAVQDNTFPGHATNALGSVTSNWLVAGYSNVRLDTRTASPPSGPGDIANDNILYLAFDEGSNYDTDATPDVTTNATPGLMVNGAVSPINPLSSSDVVERDKAAPVIIKAIMKDSVTDLIVGFSEPVDTDGPPLAANLSVSDFVYTDASGNDASSIIGISDNDGTDKNIVFNLNAAFTENDHNVDIFAFAASAVFDSAGNSGNTTSVNIRGTAKQIVAGSFHTCALFWNGKVRCWGRGVEGQLGYGTTSGVGDGVGPSIMAAGNVDVGGTVKQIAAGNAHTCALLDTGKVRCWGYGASGQLGYGNTLAIGDDETPSTAGDVNVGGTVTQIAAGYDHTCALLDTGKVRCWGSGADGRLGYNNTNNVGDGVGLSIVAAGDVNIGGTVTHIAAGYLHTCALLSTGKVRCWGSGVNGRLGYGNTNNVGDGIGLSIVAAGDVNIGGTAIQLTAGQYHTCALLSTGSVRCWGSGGFGQLGYGNNQDIANGVGPSIVAVGDVNVGGTTIQITAGQTHTCALLASGSVRCWGNGQYGRLGYNNTNHIGDSFGETPAFVGDVNVGGTIAQIVAGQNHTCALLSIGNLRCWGEGLYGKLGYGNTSNVGDGVGASIIVAGDVPAF